MPIASIVSGLTTLAGSGLAIAKMIQDDKQSRYPPEYLMYKDMMKDARKYGYPMMGMGMMNPMFGQPMIVQPQQMIQPQPIIIPQPVQQQQMLFPMMTNNGIVQQMILEYQKQQFKQQVVNSIVQQLVQRFQQRYVMNQQPMWNQSGPVQPNYPPLSQRQIVITTTSKPMWDTPADGGTGSPPPSQEPCYQLATIPKQLPNPQEMYVTGQQRMDVVPPPVSPQPRPRPRPEPIPVVPFVQPEQFRNESVIQTRPMYQQPMTCQPELCWETPNASNVDQVGFRSFVEHLDRPRVPENYVGNTLDW